MKREDMVEGICWVIIVICILFVAAMEAKSQTLSGPGRMMNGTGATYIPPPPVGSFIVTEAGDKLTTEAGEHLLTE